MTNTKLDHTECRLRAACCFVVVTLTTSIGSPASAGFIQRNVTIRAGAEASAFMRTPIFDEHELFFEPPPSILFPAAVAANTGFSSVGANAAIDTNGNLGLRTILSSTQDRGIARIAYSAEYVNQDFSAERLDFQWLLGPLDIVLDGARDSSVSVAAVTTFTFKADPFSSDPPTSLAFGASLRLAVDSDGNLTPDSGLSINGELQSVPEIDTDGDSVAVRNFFVPIPIEFAVATDLVVQSTEISVVAQTPSSSPERIRVTLDDPFNLSGNPATSVHFIDSEPDTAPVPEPSSLTLLACGLITLSGYARRKRNQRRRTPAQLPKHHDPGAVL